MAYIQDEFTARTDLSKQRKYQLRKLRDGRCCQCGRPLDKAVHCYACAAKHNSIERRHAKARRCRSVLTPAGQTLP